LEDSEGPDIAEKPERKDVTVDSLKPSTAKIFFNFRKDDLSRLIELFKFPEDCVLENGSKMKGEEVFLRGLFELSTGENQERMCIFLFGREQTQQSRAFKYFIHHMYTKYKHLVMDSLPWFTEMGIPKLQLMQFGQRCNHLDFNPPQKNFFHLNYLATSSIVNALQPVS
jgi:hypothetical protein